MALKRKTKIEPNFSMASMTDIIFLLLIFFMISSTIVIPNAIKLTLPQAQKQTAAKPLSRVTIDRNLNYYVAFGNQRDKQVSFNDITPFLQERYNQEPEMYIALYADETVPYSEIVKVLDIANRNKFKIALFTRPPEK
jgi:Biopolymer transport protein